MKHKGLLTTAIFLISLRCLYAGEVRFFDTNSISSHLITSVAQDKEGYIWVGTEYGLNRFDGVSFTHYYTHNNTLIDNNVHDVFVDSQGDVLIISGRNLQIYDKTTGLFETVGFPEGHVPVLSSIAQLHDGRIVLSNSKKGHWLVDKSSMTARPFEELDAKVGKPESHSLVVDSRGRLWICTNNDGVFCYDVEADEVMHFQTADSPSASRGVTGVVATENGDVFILGMSALFRFNERNASIENLFSFSPSLSIRRMYRSSDGTLYAGSYGKGVYEVDVERKTIVPACQDITAAYNLWNSGLYAFMEDVDGNIWMGFSSKGLLLLTKRPQPFSYTPLRDINPSSGNSLTSFSMLEDGSMFVGQSRCGIHLLDSSLRKVRTYMDGFSPISMCRISSDLVLVGDFTRGAWLLDTESGNHRCILKDRRVTDFTKDRNGNIYLSVFNGPLMSFTPDVGEERSLCKASGGLKLHGRYLNTLYTDSKGLVWVGHHYGFDVYDPASDLVLSVKCDPQLRSAIVYDIIETSDGIVWLGTSRGLFGYSRESDTWVHKAAGDGLLCEVICAVREAEDSSLWLSTYRGLIHYIRQEERFSYYLQGGGLQEVSYAHGVSAVAPDGKMYFGNNLGVTSFYPDQVVADAFVRPLKSVALVVGDKTVDVIDDRIVLAHDENTFALRFSTMDFRNPRNLSFEYSLSSSGDGDWRRTPLGYNEVDFYSLDYGDHVLRVRAVYNEGRSEVKEINVRIRPPWYLSSWAKLLYLVIALAFVLLYWSYWKHRKMAEMNEEKIRLFIDISHEIRSPLTLIKSPLESIIGIPHDEHTTHALRAIQRNTDRLLLLVNQILSIRKIEKGQMKMHYAETDMLGFVREYVQDYEYAALKRGIDLRIDGPEEPIMCWIDRENFGKVVSNLVSNALKYVEDGGMVSVTVRKTGRYIEMTVADNGRGIDEKQLKYVFERFYQVPSDKSSSQLGFGIGLNLSSQLVRMHGGSIQARNRTGESGSEFMVRLPSGNGHIPADCIVGPEYFTHARQDFKEETVPEEDTARRMSARKRTDFRVVVVDDDEEVRRFLKDELSKSYYVSAYPDGRQALEAVTDNPPDLVISDVQMPDMDGFTLLKRIKNNTSTSHVPVILLTTKVEHQSRLDGFGYGADAYLDKPFNVEELMMVSSSLIDNRIRMKAKLSGVQEQKGVLKPIEMKGNDAALMERIMSCINRRICDSDFNVEALADEVGLSRVQLHRRVKDITGITVGEFLRNLRMKQAAELLAKGDVTVSQVTYAVGMSNPTHFTTAFKKYFGVTPTEYINKHSGDTKTCADAT